MERELIALVLERLPGAELRADVIKPGLGLPEISVQLPDRHVLWGVKGAFLEKAEKARLVAERTLGAATHARYYDFLFRNCLCYDVGRVHVRVSITQWVPGPGYASTRTALYLSVSDELTRVLTHPTPNKKS